MPIELDGSRGSGSGTVVRTGVALSALLGEPLHLFNIRARRRPPGLRPQHLRVVEAVAQMSRGSLGGAVVGGRELLFRPGGVLQGGRYQWNIGTAGSTTMLALTLLPLACFASGPVVARISGGLFQDFAPSALHMQGVLLPLLARMGLKAELHLLRPGYVPRGGGLIELRVWPLEGPLRPLDLSRPPGDWHLEGVALSSHLRRRQVSERMARVCREALAREGLEASIRVVYDETAPQPGAALALFARGDGVTLGADMAGAPGRTSEHIGRTVARALLEDLRSGATVDRHLADQIVLFSALAQGETRYLVPRLTEHLETNLWLVRELLGAGAEVQGNLVCIKGVGYRPRH